MPFGKYKGMPIKTVIDDKSYIGWLAEQDWMKSKFSNLLKQLQASGESKPKVKKPRQAIALADSRRISKDGNIITLPRDLFTVPYLGPVPPWEDLE
jgi:hypothetical protein